MSNPWGMKVNRGAAVGLAIFLIVIMAMIIAAVSHSGGGSEPYGADPQVCSQGGYGNC